MNIIILGPPGSGKGTQSAYLVANYNFHHLSTGDLLRSEMNAQSDLGMLVSQAVNAGKYVDDEIMNKIVVKVLGEVKNNFILDGYPRTVAQAQYLYDYLQANNLKIDIALRMAINKQKIIDRLQNRLICPTCKASYNKISAQPLVKWICDQDQSSLIQRVDDQDAHKIITRIDEYEALTLPLINWYQERGLLYVVDGSLESSEVNVLVSKIIDSYEQNHGND